MQRRKGRRDTGQTEAEGVAGLPSFNYRLPLIVSTLAGAVIFIVTGVLAVISLGRLMGQVDLMSSNQGGDPVFLACICAPFTLILLGGTLYFLGAMVKGLRDLMAPVHYTRGTVADRKFMTEGRKTSWLHVDAHYSGPDLGTASHVTDEERATSTDRSRVFQPRFTPDNAPQGGIGVPQSAYLPSERLSADPIIEQAGTGSTKPPILFRADSIARTRLETGQEVLVAHSPYLQHVYYVARLKDGEWESYPNRTLI